MSDRLTFADLVPVKLRPGETVRPEFAAQHRNVSSHTGFILNRSHKCLEHEVKLAGLGKLAAAGRTYIAIKLIGAPSQVAAFTFYQWVGKTFQMATSFPDSGVHKDTGIQADDIISLLYYRLPPCLFYIILKLYTQRPIVPAAG